MFDMPLEQGRRPFAERAEADHDDRAADAAVHGPLGHCKSPGARGEREKQRRRTIIARAAPREVLRPCMRLVYAACATATDCTARATGRRRRASARMTP